MLYNAAARKQTNLEDDAPKSTPQTREYVVSATPISPPTPAKGGGRRQLVRAILMLVLPLLAGLCAAYIYLTGGRYVSTDNAYVQADMLAVSTDVAGIVKEIDVREGEEVRAGQVLFRLDPQPFEIALDGAKADLAQAALSINAMKQDYQRMLRDIDAQQARVEFDQAQYARYAALVKSHSVSVADYDLARFTLAGAEQTLASLKQQAEVQLTRLNGNPAMPPEQHPQYRQAKARVDEAQRQLDHGIVRAPFDGVVTRIDSLQPGQYLAASAAAIRLVAIDHVWVEGNPKETDLTYVRPGDRATIMVDAYPDKTWAGTVETISPASGAEFALLPPQNSGGNWVKVVQRIPVRIRVARSPGDPTLRAGMSAVIEIDTGHKRSLSDLL